MRYLSVAEIAKKWDVSEPSAVLEITAPRGV